jgi:orotate phosphoribosyltransferase
LQELYRPEYGETIASVELGGVVPATELASSFGLPHVIVRKRAKAHGRGGIIAGDLAVVEGEHVLVVEDTGTTLQSVEDAVRTLRKHGAIVTDVFLLVSYQFPELLAKAEELKIRLHHVFSVDLLITMAMLMDRIDPKYRELLWAWLEDPRAPWEWPK